MQIQLFYIPVIDNADALKEMNQFLATHKVLEVEQKFHYQSHYANWCFCVRYIGSQYESNLLTTRAKIDYKQILTEKEFSVFSQLREFRKQLATADAVPAYAVFTDEELANIARLNEISYSKIKSVNGIGLKRQKNMENS